MENLVSHIQEVQATLPKQQRLLCEYICSHLLEVGMLTIAELADKAGVGTATVTRMAYSLGYKSYNQFKTDLREAAIASTHSSYHTYWDSYQKQMDEHILSDELDICKGIIDAMNNLTYITQIESAAKAILAAQRTYVLGLRTSALSSFCLEYRLLDEGIDVYSLSREPEFLFDRLVDIRHDDILVVCASKPAAKKSIDALKICHSRHIQTLLITTRPFPEVEPYASFIISSNTEDALLATVPPIITVELLSREISRRSGHKNRDHYQKVEELIQDNDIVVWG